MGIYSLLGLSTGAIVGIVVGVVVILLVIIIVAWYIATHNKLVRMKNSFEEAFSTIDIYLKKRFDLIPNIVETVKGYAKHESETYQKITDARARLGSAHTPDEKIAADRQMTAAVRSLFAVAENYPQLKANTNFMDLQSQLKSMEGEIAQSRKYYNATVREFNIAIQSFPTSIVAKKMKLEKASLYEVDSPEERQNVKVSF